MGVFHNANISKKKIKENVLRINISKGKVNLIGKIFKYRDKDTRQIIYYIPSLEITAYGSTDEKAMEMLNFSIDELFTHLVGLSQSQLELELSKLGWKQTLYKKKEYSKAYVDADGNLQQFNAVADEVEQLTVEI